MATGNVIVTAVDVGQGQSTFVEIYNDTAVLIHTLLFDCGTDKPSARTTTNLDYITAKALEKNPPGFDAIFFSHSDKDHISLAEYILKKVKAAKPSTAKVNRVWYGGCPENYIKYKGKSNEINPLNYLAKSGLCAVSDIKGFTADSTSYDTLTKSFTGRLWENPDKDVYVSALAANVISDDPDWDESEDLSATKSAEEKNRVSLIACLFYAGASYVICGDATSRTMGAVNSLLAAGTTVFNKNIMTTLPHHGSRATGLAVKSGAVASTASIAVVDTFAALMKSVSITISAYEKHRHPSLELMNRFIPTQKTPILRDIHLVQKNAHRITSYIDVDITTGTAIIILNCFAYSFESEINTFSTRYSDWGPYFAYNLGTAQAKASQGVVATLPLTTINPFACWRYTTSSAGSTLVGGYADLTTPLTRFTGPALASLFVKSAEQQFLLAEPVADFTKSLLIPIAEPLPAFSVRIKFKVLKTQSESHASIQTNLKQYY